MKEKFERTKPHINIGTIASGTILAAGLYFGAGLLV